MAYSIKEIFYTLQGEGANSGILSSNRASHMAQYMALLNRVSVYLSEGPTTATAPVGILKLPIEYRRLTERDDKETIDKALETINNVHNTIILIIICIVA